MRTRSVSVLILGLLLVISGVFFGTDHAVYSSEETPADNTFCVVCHLDLKKELIAAKHLEQDITCMQCHGSSTEHMQDEMLMTKPDILFGRTEVEPMCCECHETHQNPDAVEAFRKEWLGKHRENGRAITQNAVCTDCHGTHNIVTEMGTLAKATVEPKWTSLFNGEDLSGWKPTGGATWTVERGCLVGRQGPNYAPGDLFTEEEFGDFELIVTFKMQWPGNSGVWFRYRAPDKAYQADILEYTDPVCYTGSLYCPGKMFIAMNEDPSILNRDLWNTLKVRAQGDHLVITLNDVVTADVHEDSFDRGRIGFQVHPGDEFKDMKITLRELLIRPLPPAGE